MLRPRLDFSHHDDDHVFHQFPLKQDHLADHTFSIHLHPDDAALAVMRIFHLNLIDRLAMPILEAKTWPVCRDYRINLQLIPPYFETQEPLQSRPGTSMPPTRYTRTSRPGRSAQAGGRHQRRPHRARPRNARLLPHRGRARSG